MNPSPRRLLHVDLLALRPEASNDVRSAILKEAAGLRAIESVLAGAAIEALPGSDADLVLMFVLESLAALEAFGTDARYAAFLQKTLAPHLAGLSGADVALEGEMPEPAAAAVCLVLAAPEGTYDWQIKSDLAAWAAQAAPAAAAIGLAAGERQRYRGLAVVFRETLPSPMPPPPFGYGALIAAGPARALT